MRTANNAYNSSDQRKIDEGIKEIDPLDTDTEEGSAENNSKSKIKTITTGRGLIIIGVLAASGIIAYKSFTGENKIVQQTKSEDIPLSQQIVPTRRGGSVMTKKESEKLNPFLGRDDDSKSSDFIDPELPPLDLGTYTQSASGVPIPLQPKLIEGNGLSSGIGKLIIVDKNNNIIPWAVSVSDKKTGEKITKTGILGYAINAIGARMFDNNKNPIEGQIKFQTETDEGNSVQEPDLVMPTDSNVTITGNTAQRMTNQEAGLSPQTGLANGPSPTVGMTPSQAQAEQRNKANNGNVVINGVTLVDTETINIDEKRKTPMFVISGGGPAQRSKRKGTVKKSDFLIVDSSVVSPRISPENTIPGSKRIANPATTVLKGRIFDAVILVSLNTQFPGAVEAIVTNDVYGTSGTAVIVPKGSRLHGTYSSTVAKGQSRIDIFLDELTRPQGDQYVLSSRVTDQYGRIGVQGDVDNRFGDNAINAALYSALGLLTGVFTQAIQTGLSGSGNTGQSQIVNPNGTFTTTNIMPINYAAQAAIQTLRDSADKITQGTSNLPPIISLPHGTKIKVMLTMNFTAPPAKKLLIQ